MKRKGLALSRRLASCLLAATLAAGLAAPQAAVYAGEPDAILEEETESGEDMYTGPDEDVPEETEDPSLDLYPDAAEDSYSEPYSDPYVDASPYIDPSEDAENADAPIEDTAQEGLVPEGASGDEPQYRRMMSIRKALWMQSLPGTGKMQNLTEMTRTQSLSEAAKKPTAQRKSRPKTQP